MYVVKIFDGPDDLQGVTIHSALVNTLKLDSGLIKKEISKVDSFSVKYNLANPGYGKIKPFRTLVKVLNTKTNKYEFEGRALSPTDNMNESGEFATSFVFEGELSYLRDAPQRHLEFRGTPYELLKTQLDYFNSQVESYKHFQIGNVTVTDPNDYMYLYLSAERDTYESIQNSLLERLGGELQIRKENGIRYLDYQEKIGHESDVEIKLARNLLSISKKVDPTEVVTRLTPLGTRIESDDENATDASEARITIESVNNGIPYIDRLDLISIFGIQGKSIVWDGITIPSNLKASGTKWLNNQKTILNQYTINAIDLFKIGMDIEQFDIGNSHPTKNAVMGINERLRIVGKTIDVITPEKDTLIIGDKFKNANEYQSDFNKSTKKVLELQSIVNGQSARIGSLSTSLAAATETVGKLVNDLAGIDIENLPTELQGIAAQLIVLQNTLADIEQAIGQIPVYGPANSTTAGLLIPELYMKLMSIELATELIDGLMSKEDKKKVNQIDNILQRLELLEGGN